MRILLLTLTLLTCVPLSAQAPDTPSAPLQAGPVQAFIHLISSTRSASPQSSAAKVQALRVFNELYANGSPAMQELLGTFVHQLQKLVDKKMILPRNKEQRVVMLMEETKHLLSHLQEDATNDGYFATASANELMVHLYTALNPTFADFWRNVTKGMLTTVQIGLSLTLIYFLYKIARQFIQVQNGEGTLGRGVNAMCDINDGKGVLSGVFKEGTRFFHMMNNYSEKYYEAHGEYPPSSMKKFADAIEEMLKTYDVNDPNVPILHMLFGSMAQILRQGNQHTEECLARGEPAPKGNFHKIADFCEHMMKETGVSLDEHLDDPSASFAQQLSLAIGRVCMNVAVQDYIERKIPAKDRIPGSFAKLTDALKYGIEHAWNDGKLDEDSTKMDAVISSVVKLTDITDVNQMITLFSGFIEDLRNKSNSVTWVLGNPSASNTQEGQARQRFLAFLERGLKALEEKQSELSRP